MPRRRLLPAEDAIANEEVRLKYRYLDLRRTEMQAEFYAAQSSGHGHPQLLVGEGFLEIETPFMTRYPRGRARLSRPQPRPRGQLYALPQSPQIFKQILMVSGFDRYFQIARCFRDEDLRADRQPEFTQIDLEISFPQMDTIFRVTEGFLAAARRPRSVTRTRPRCQASWKPSQSDLGPPSSVERPVLALTMPAAPNRAPISITRSEARLVTVVFAGDPDAAVSVAARGHGTPALEAALDVYGGQLTELPGRSILVTQWGAGSAVDRAGRAACAR